MKDNSDSMAAPKAMKTARRARACAVTGDVDGVQPW